MNHFVLPDQAHIERIRHHLWVGREFGRAAVMVGAGFSRQAQRLSPMTDPFPLWSDLEDRWARALGREVGRDTGVRLASEYEIVFGRTALDQLVLDAIPDEAYGPGYLHEILLTLPWSDVFTTNYDTLLERARPRVHNRKYDLVLTNADIPGRMKPRIVKLHGSFPSHRPFIITEEDYRTYPRRSAPFVNMVQQSLMENIFCLVGFSGDDPNFFFWSGWVRDNLGEAASPMYLCGVLNLSASKRQLLQQRNVIPVDLSPLFPDYDWPDREVRHAKALEWFLLTLMEGEPPNPLVWPNLDRPARFAPSSGLPQPLPWVP